MHVPVHVPAYHVWTNPLKASVAGVSEVSREEEGEDEQYVNPLLK